MMPFEYKKNIWICNICNKEHLFRSDAERCYDLCKHGVDVVENEEGNLLQYNGFKRKKEYIYQGRKVEILSLYDSNLYPNFYPITIGYNDELSGWLGYLTIDQAKNNLKDTIE